jgi:hypothetical protein
MIKYRKKIVHIGLTPLAGSIIRLNNALNAYSDYDSRFICLMQATYNARDYDDDLYWDDNKKTCLEWIRKADILQFHHFMHVDSLVNPFQINFCQIKKKSAIIMFHWHTSIDNIAKNYEIPKTYLENLPYRQFVIAQYHTRYFPKAIPVPQIHEAEKNLQMKDSNKNKITVFYAPSHTAPAFSNRWESKGYDLISKLLHKLKQQGICNIDIAQNIPFAECQQRMHEADVVIDDLINGSFHLVTLEGLALGKPTICFMDHHTSTALIKVTMSYDLPIINAHYEDVEPIIRLLSLDDTLRTSIAEYSKFWYEKYFSTKKLIQSYVKHYEQLFSNTDTNQADLCEKTSYKSAREFLDITLNDIKWDRNKKKYLSIGCRVENILRNLFYKYQKKYVLKTLSMIFHVMSLTGICHIVSIKKIVFSHQVLNFIYFQRKFTEKELRMLVKHTPFLCKKAKILLASALFELKRKNEAKSTLSQLRLNPVDYYHSSFSILSNALFEDQQGIFTKIFESNQIDEFLSYLNQKSIAVVGNSPCEINLNRGRDIDNHDVIFRFNNFYQCGKKFSDDYGEKTSVWVHSAWDDVVFSKDLLDQVAYVLFINESKYIQWNALPTLIKIVDYCPEKIVFASIDDLRKINNLTKSIHLSTGIKLLYLLMIKQIAFDIYGFKLVDQKEGSRRYYFTDKTFQGTIHKWRHEEKLLNQVQKYCKLT